jgi:hypothetical protein
MPSNTLNPKGAADVEEGGPTGKFVYELHWICEKVSIITEFCEKYTYT